MGNSQAARPVALVPFRPRQRGAPGLCVAPVESALTLHSPSLATCNQRSPRSRRMNASHKRWSARCPSCPLIQRRAQPARMRTAMMVACSISSPVRPAAGQARPWVCSRGRFSSPPIPPVWRSQRNSRLLWFLPAGLEATFNEPSMAASGSRVDWHDMVGLLSGVRPGAGPAVSLCDHWSP